MPPPDSFPIVIAGARRRAINLVAAADAINQSTLSRARRRAFGGAA
jgi:hypothetical protein